MATNKTANNPQELFRDAARLVGRALTMLETSGGQPCGCCGAKKFTALQERKAHDQFENLPARLVVAAQAIDEERERRAVKK